MGLISLHLPGNLWRNWCLCRNSVAGMYLKIQVTHSSQVIFIYVGKLIDRDCFGFTAALRKYYYKVGF